MTDITINPDRFLADLARLRSFGACGNGVVRPAFSSNDMAARKWLAQRMGEAGLTPLMDPAGNLFGLPQGTGKCLLLGSHSDTQPEGGWLDGAYGVIAGLEVARAAIECGGPPVAVVSFQEEEGRFSGPLIGSGIWSGKLTLDQADKLTDNAGLTFGEVRQSIAGFCGSDFVSPERFTGFIEPHIEQGPVLDRVDEVIGVVSSIVGIRSEEYCFTGEQNHAGTTPMGLRRDAFQGLVQFADTLNRQLVDIVTPESVWTIGHVALHPNATSIVPGQARFSVQMRDADDARLDQMLETSRQLADHIAKIRGLGFVRSAFSSMVPTRIDQTLMDRIADASERHAKGLWRKMPSGALHDAANVARLMPVAMLFVPSINGISHDFAEDTKIDHLVLGVTVLAASVAP